MLHDSDYRTEKDLEQSLSDDLQTLVGDNLRTERAAQNLTQQDLGNLAGFGKQYIGRIENGQINLTLSTMGRLAAALGKNVRFFFQPLNTL